MTISAALSDSIAAIGPVSAMDAPVEEREAFLDRCVRIYGRTPDRDQAPSP